MKYKYPIRIPVGWKLTISQVFKPDIHEGNDVITGDPSNYGTRTFGLPFVWPFPFPGKIYDSVADSPIAAVAKKAHAQVDGMDPITGITYSLLVIHLSGTTYTVAAGQSSDVVFNEGDTIGYLGNSGMVSPKPTLEKPFDGSHAHVALGIKKPGEANYTMVDPSLYFDVNDPWHGPDDPSRDQPVYDWAAARTPAEPVVSQNLYTFAHSLGKGSNGGDVVVLQYILKLEGCFDYPTLTGYYGDITVAGVRKLQEKYADQILRPLGFSVGTGFFGPSTMAWVNQKYGLSGV